MEESEVLTKDKAVPQNILPTGRKVGMVHSKGSGRVTIGYVDGKPGKLPEEYQGEYTGLSQAERDIKRFVKALWDVSEKAQTKKPLSTNNNAVSR